MKDLDKIYAEKIAEEYAPKYTTKVIKLKKLDEKVKRPAEITGYIFGVIAVLILGTGMSIIMTDFGPNGSDGFITGIIIGTIGLSLCGINYLIYKTILKSRKSKYAFEITELAKEIAKEE